MTLEQIKLFFIFILIGYIIGIIFDIFRIFRKVCKIQPNWFVYIQDAIFLIIVGTIVIYTVFIFNNGEFRFFVILSMIIGVITYIRTFSKIFIATGVRCTKPISFFVINIKKTLLKLKNIFNMTNFAKKKKDFNQKKSIY